MTRVSRRLSATILLPVSNHHKEFIDLKTQYQRYQAEIVSRINRVFDHGMLIMGPEMEELERSTDHG